MSKIKFKECQVKNNNGFIETVNYAYFDITSEIKSMFGNSVKRALLIVDNYYPLQDPCYRFIEDWKKRWREDDSFNISKECIELEGENIVCILFENNRVIEFVVSEWSTISSMNEIPEILK